MFRFLHLADVHLDTTFLCRSEVLRSRLRQALREAFERAVDCALEENVHAVLIAGDLFDNERLSFATERFLRSQLQRLDEAGVVCVYVTGNHDPGGGRYRASHIDWPASFRYLRSRVPEVVDIFGAGGRVVGRVVGAGHVTAREQDNLAAAFPVPQDGVPHVGLLHALVTSATDVDRHDRYAPCTVADLREAGYAYWALGHVHTRQQVCETPPAHYPGNVQGRNPRETGPKGGLMVTLREGYAPEVTFRSFAPVQWLAVRLERLEAARTFHDLLERARAAFAQASAGGDADTLWILRVTLSGACPLAGEITDDEQRVDLEQQLTDVLGVLDVEVRYDGLTPPVDVDAHRGEPHLLGEVLALLEEAAADPALLEQLAPDDLAAATDDRAGYLMTLLEGLDREAATRLLIREP